MATEWAAMGANRHVRPHKHRRWAWSAERRVGLAAAVVALCCASPVLAVTSESPEVQRLIAAGLAALEKPGSDIEDLYAERLGGQCLAGLAFVKAGKPNHPRVAAAIDACRTAMTSGEKIDVYSNGIAIVFLC